MFDDDIIKAIRAARHEYCQRFGYDLSAISRDLQEQQRAGGRQVVSLPPCELVRTELGVNEMTTDSASLPPRS